MSNAVFRLVCHTDLRILLLLSLFLPTEGRAEVNLRCDPGKIELVGRLDAAQLVLSNTQTPFHDLTHLAEWRVTDPTIAAVSAGFVRPRGSGSTTITATVGTRTITIPLTVRDYDKEPTVGFRHDVIAALNVGGCNAGACHGTPSGKNGFRLSLRGFDPAADHRELTRDVFGRRTSVQSPASALILQKGLGEIAHEGGRRFVPNSVAVERISAWLKNGCPDDPPTLPSVIRLSVEPGPRILHAPHTRQQLRVCAHFSDGSIRDVTRLSVYTSSDLGIADVSPNGLVEFRTPGETAILVRYLETLQAVRFTYLEPRPDFRPQLIPEVNYIDTHVFAKLNRLNMEPSRLTSDTDFIRRIFLDVLGILPTPKEVAAFLQDSDPDKRIRLIDELLTRHEYADFWALKWGDVLRSTRKTMHLKGAIAFRLWLKNHFHQNTNFAEVVRELLTATGRTLSVAPSNYFRVVRDPQSLAETTAQVFLGVRMQCARCHNHPFERWTQDDYFHFAAFFTRVGLRDDPDAPKKEMDVGGEIVFRKREGEIVQPRTNRTLPPKFLGGAVIPNDPAVDRRVVLADWLMAVDNPFFAKATVNRVWYHLFGKGIVDPVDDFRDSNPSANDELLDALAQDFIRNGYDMKKLIRTIVMSRTYQLSAEPTTTNRDDTKYFARAYPKQLPAEVLLDAICSVLEVPEKFPGFPLGTRAVELPDSELSHPFMKAFGQPGREIACECERESESNLGQALQLFNGPTMNRKMHDPNNRIGRLLAARTPPETMVRELYLATLSRLPTSTEQATVLEHVAKASDPRKAWEDALWALINLPEFLYRH